MVDDKAHPTLRTKPRPPAQHQPEPARIPVVVCECCTCNHWGPSEIGDPSRGTCGFKAKEYLPFWAGEARHTDSDDGYNCDCWVPLEP